MNRKIFVLIVIFLVFGIFLVLSHSIGNFRMFIVTSGSMEPTIPTGALVGTYYTNPHNLKKGDVITFIPPTKKREFVTHRITKAIHQQTLSIFKTKGDKNSSEDTWTLAGGAIIGKVIVFIPYLGYFFSFIQSKIGILLCILLPTVYLLVNEIQNLITIFKNHKKNSETTNIIILCLLYNTAFVISSAQQTQTLLSDRVVLIHNTIKIQSTKLLHGRHHDGDEDDDEDNDNDDQRKNGDEDESENEKVYNR